MPYPWILFSWICHYWRTIVLGNVAFWTTVVFDKHMTSNFLKKLLERSRTAPLEIIVLDSVLSVVIFMNCWKCLGKEADRVKTFHVDSDSIHLLCFSQLTSFFPSLENIFFDTCGFTDSFDVPIATLSVQSHLKALRFSVRRLGCLAMPGQFPGLRWLELKYDSSIPLLFSCQALQYLPCLQFLHLCAPYWTTSTTSAFPGPIVTLPELRVLIAEYLVPRFINAPKLMHLKIDYPAGYDNDDNFCGFDFSGITRLYFGITTHDFRIWGSSHPEADFFLDHGGVKSVFDPIPDSYPCRIQISLEDLTPFKALSTKGPSSLFNLCIQRAANIQGIALACYESDPPNFWTQDDLNSFLKVLQGTTAVREFALSCGSSFATLCDVLSNRTLLPHLERLIYFNDSRQSQSLTELYPLQKLMIGRSGTGPRPLNIGLMEFPAVQPELLEHIEGLGIRLTQVSKNSVIGK
ncbi:hypothetical protein Clacol_000109 [Clathrus columnatus]|uniref:Uncharacterized protein n=1 Tax=Clathrus columnatus TaxID=1419009 RepID=A0AAV4ZY24_9AGAM|nr:hypothetical protein Clacol_000109 [Clathrus columnatus]